MATRSDCVSTVSCVLGKPGIGVSILPSNGIQRPVLLSMLSLISNLVLFITAFALMLLVDDNPSEVTLLEYLMFGVMLYTGYSIFKIILKRWHDENGPL